MLQSTTNCDRQGSSSSRCAGFMRIMTAGFVDTWRDRMINIHPSLLPSYKGLHTHERALADGVKIHGCTCISCAMTSMLDRSSRRRQFRLWKG